MNTKYSWTPQTNLTGWISISSVQVLAITPVCWFKIFSKKGFGKKLVFTLLLIPLAITVLPRRHFSSSACVMLVPPFDYPWRHQRSRESPLWRSTHLPNSEIFISQNNAFFIVTAHVVKDAVDAAELYKIMIRSLVVWYQPHEKSIPNIFNGCCAWRWSDSVTQCRICGIATDLRVKSVGGCSSAEMRRPAIRSTAHSPILGDWDRRGEDSGTSICRWYCAVWGIGDWVVTFVRDYLAGIR